MGQLKHEQNKQMNVGAKELHSFVKRRFPRAKVLNYVCAVTALTQGAKGQEQVCQVATTAIDNTPGTILFSFVILAVAITFVVIGIVIGRKTTTPQEVFCRTCPACATAV